MKRNKRGILRLMTICGAALLLLAALIVMDPIIKGKRAAAGLQKIAETLDCMLPGHDTAGFSETLPYMPILVYEKTDYSALLDFDRLHFSFPVREAPDGDDGTKGPFRSSGSVYENTLVIGGMNIGGQFGFFDQLDISDTLRVTDMRGRVFFYEITAVKRPKNPDWDALREQGADLILYSYTPYRTEYRIVMCRRIQQFETGT